MADEKRVIARIMAEELSIYYPGPVAAAHAMRKFLEQRGLDLDKPWKARLDEETGDYVYEQTQHD